MQSNNPQHRLGRNLPHARKISLKALGDRNQEQRIKNKTRLSLLYLSGPLLSIYGEPEQIQLFIL